MQTEKLNLHVSGMTCGHCQSFVKNLLNSTEGVKSAEVDLKTGNAEIEFEPSKTTKEDLVRVINNTETYSAQ